MAIPAIGSNSALSGAGVSAPSTSVRVRFLRTLFSSKKATAGLVILLVISFVAAFPGLLTHDDPNAAIYGVGQGPSPQSRLGTPRGGQDVFPQLVYGPRLTLV